jgi:hypothetical protein
MEHQCSASDRPSLQSWHLAPEPEPGARPFSGTADSMRRGRGGADIYLAECSQRTHTNNTAASISECRSRSHILLHSLQHRRGSDGRRRERQGLGRHRSSPGCPQGTLGGSALLAVLGEVSLPHRCHSRPRHAGSHCRGSFSSSHRQNRVVALCYPSHPVSAQCILDAMPLRVVSNQCMHMHCILALLISDLSIVIIIIYHQ